MKGVHTAVVLAAVMALGAVSVARAEDPTRPQYVEQVEPICKANTEANMRILKNVQTKARSRDAARMKEAGAQFIRASAVFGKALGRIAAVSRPPQDDARLVRWFTQLGVVREKLRKLGVALREGDEIKAAHEQIRVERASNAANNVGFVFEFHYCRLTKSRFVQ
jgi:hypothetical protein